MVVGQGEVDHRADRDDIAAVVADDNRALDDTPGAEDRHLWLVDDRRIEERAAAAGVGEGEGPSGELVRRHAIGAGPVGEVGDAPSEPRDTEVTRIPHDGHEQSAIGIDGDAEVDLTVVGHRAGGEVE